MEKRSFGLFVVFLCFFFCIHRFEGVEGWGVKSICVSLYKYLGKILWLSFHIPKENVDFIMDQFLPNINL